MKNKQSRKQQHIDAFRKGLYALDYEPSPESSFESGYEMAEQNIYELKEILKEILNDHFDANGTIYYEKKNRNILLLDALDDDTRSGKRRWPLKKCPTIKDVRRWKGILNNFDHEI